MIFEMHDSFDRVDNEEILQRPAIEDIAFQQNQKTGTQERSSDSQDRRYIEYSSRSPAMVVNLAGLPHPTDQH